MQIDNKLKVNCTNMLFQFTTGGEGSGDPNSETTHSHSSARASS